MHVNSAQTITVVANSTNSYTVADQIASAVNSSGLSQFQKLNARTSGARVVLDEAVEGSGLFFNAGTSDLKSEAKPVLNKIGDLMSRFPYEISIEGHTDNVKITGGRYASNWDLSAERAYSALQYLRETSGVNPGRLHIAGFADTKPIATNDTAEGRAKNRRVEFVFYRQHLKFEDGDSR